MGNRQGMTLMEIIVVLIIIGIAAAFCLPNFTTPTEQARALNAKNNLLAIYSAQQNYHNNNGSYCINSGGQPTCADKLADINTNLSLNIQDDGTYVYACASDATGFSCTASRSNSSSNLVIKVIDSAIQLTGGVNPSCSSSTGNSNWCP